MKMYMASFLKDLTCRLPDNYLYHETTFRGKKGRDGNAKDQWSKSTEVIAWIQKPKQNISKLNQPINNKKDNTTG